MRCIACNGPLLDWEATNRSVYTGNFLDLCGGCLVEADIVGTKNPRVKEKSSEEVKDE